MQVREDQVDARQLFPVGRVIGRKHYLCLAQLVTGRLDHFADDGWADLRAILIQNLGQERHRPGSAIDAMVGGRFMEQAENSAFYLFVVNLAI